MFMWQTIHLLKCFCVIKGQKECISINIHFRLNSIYGKRVNPFSKICLNSRVNSIHPIFDGIRSRNTSFSVVFLVPLNEFFKLRW